MSLSMLEQIALRFETYANDQDGMIRRSNLVRDKADRKLKAAVWRDAAKELRTIGADNRDAFIADVAKVMVDTLGQSFDKVAAAQVALFITPHIVPPPVMADHVTYAPPIPAPTPRDYIQQVSRKDPLRDTVSNLFSGGTKTARLKGSVSDDQQPCDKCGDYHPSGVLEAGLCPSCCDAEDDVQSLVDRDRE